MELHCRISLKPRRIPIFYAMILQLIFQGNNLTKGKRNIRRLFDISYRAKLNLSSRDSPRLNENLSLNLESLDHK